MTFNSWEFLLFYPIVALLYFVLPRKFRMPLLLIASYLFYMCYQAELVFLIFGTTLISWLASMAIERTESLFKKRLLLSAVLTVCLGVLFFYKYFNFLSDTVFDIARAFGAEGEGLSLNLLLPVGISFYTFQTLSYVIDVYRGDIKTERNFLWYALFVSFFPQLVAGPIERPGNLLPQLKEEHKFERDNFIRGSKYMLLGFFKKVCVADLVAEYVNSVYNNAGDATSLGVLIATLLFAVQIYCDFSGYTDIATGCARIMGIRFMKNFDRPYSSATVKEFWARWHISLSGWFRDYLYIPLGGSRCKKLRHLFNLAFVFIVSGLWHGAALTFVLWGAIHAFYRVCGELTYPYRRKLLEKLGKSESDASVLAVRRLLTAALVAFAWIFFRANSIGDAFSLVGTLFTGVGSLSETVSLMGIDLIGAVTVVSALVILAVCDRMLVYGNENDGSGILTRDGAFIYFIWIILLGFLLLLSRDMASTFIYFQF